jgi:CBS domain-containing protein
MQPPSLMSLTAADIMERTVVTVPPDLRLAELEDLLLSRRIGGVPVVEKGTLVGIVSRSDVVRSLSLGRSLAGIVAEGLGSSAPESALVEQLRARTVRDAMVADVVTVTPDTPIRDVARVLVERHLHRVPVAAGGKLLGVISSLDLVRVIAEGRVGER